MPNAICAIKIAMETRRDCVFEAASALASMIEYGDELLYGQAMRQELVQFLLALLESPGAIQSENRAAARALIVKAIKTMQIRTSRYAEQVTSVLEQNATWRGFRDQKHDLFFSETPSSGNNGKFIIACVA